MTRPIKKTMLTEYIKNLKERTRAEKGGKKNGLDWVIYNMAIQEGLIECRLPFYRTTSETGLSTKSDREFGIDMSFISKDGQYLRIYVIKDEELSYKNWTKHGFDKDMLMAAFPDLYSNIYKDVNEVEVVLAYNKDDNVDGIRLFDAMIAGLPDKIDNGVLRTFSRMNLTVIVEEVGSRLLSPVLFPLELYNSLSYVCSLFEHSQHESDKWVKDLVPAWNIVLDKIITSKLDVSNIYAIPVAIDVIRSYGDANITAETGIIDIIEWSMLRLRGEYVRSSAKIRKVIINIWNNVYVEELSGFYSRHGRALTRLHGISSFEGHSYIGVVASAIRAQWHVARMGLMLLENPICAKDVDKQEDDNIDALFVSFMNSEPGALRPILDLHHIQLYLIARVLLKYRKVKELEQLLKELTNRLIVRASTDHVLPFIDGANSIRNVFDYIVYNEKPSGYVDATSQYILCLLWIAMGLPVESSHIIMRSICDNIVVLKDKISSEQNLDTEYTYRLLQTWLPPDDFLDNIWYRSLQHEGTSYVLHLDGVSKGDLISQIISQTHIYFRNIGCKQKDEGGIYEESVLLLACIKHNNPVPPCLWHLILDRDDSEYGKQEQQ
jgi:hypothetical protein